MKKEFLDKMYELRSLIQADIDRLVDICKQDRFKCCENMDESHEPSAELRTRRSQIGSTNKLIEEYLDIHKQRWQMNANGLCMNCFKNYSDGNKFR